MANASARGRTATRTSRAAASSALTVASMASTRSPRHPLELEVHPTRPGLHVPAGDERAVVAPDDAAQGVEGGVRPHQREPPGPVEVDLDDVADRRRFAVAGLELVDDLAAGLARGTDRPGPAVRGTDDETAIGRLSAAARVEDGPIEHDQRWLPDLDRGDARLDGAGVGVDVADLLAGRGHAATAARVTWRSASRSSWEWTVQTNAYAPASSGRDVVASGSRRR